MAIEQNVVSVRNLTGISSNTAGARLVIGLAWAFSIVVFADIQLNLGTDIQIIFMASAALFCCAVPLLVFGVNDILSVFILGLLSKYSFFPLWIKTFYGERIDIGLTAPFLTFQMAVVASVICCAALLLVKLIPGRWSLLECVAP